MKFKDRITSTGRVVRSAWAISGTGSRPVVTEAETLAGLATEMEGFRGDGLRATDLLAWDQTRMQNVALYLYRHNHMAKRMLEIIVDFALGDGMTVKAVHKDEGKRLEIQDIIDTFWSDPINDMDRFNPQRLVDYNLWGEMLMPVMVNEYDRSIRLGWIDPVNILKIIDDSVTGRASVIELSDTAANEVGHKQLEVIRFDHNKNKMVGNCFYHTMNTVMSGQRGVSEFYTAADWFDIHDQTMKVSADRAKMMLNFIWDVTLNGMDDTQIAEWLKKQKPPKPNSIKAHNEKVTWEAKAPQLGSYESSRHMKDLKTHILGGFGYPNHWFGAGDDANLATASVMAEPTKKALRRKTKQFAFAIKDVVNFQLYQKIEGGQLQGVDPMSEMFKVDVPDIGGPDVASAGSAMQAATSAITAGMDAGLVSEDTGRRLFATVASLLGIEIDAAKEKEMVEQARAQRAESDAAEDEKTADRMRAALEALDKPDPVPAV